jgi:hypothetical protein
MRRLKLHCLGRALAKTSFKYGKVKPYFGKINRRNSHETEY